MRHLKNYAFYPHQHCCRPAVIAMGFSSIAMAGKATVALPSGELGATSYDPIRSSKLNTCNVPDL